MIFEKRCAISALQVSNITYQIWLVASDEP
jgi:hypothetical protein